MRIRLCRSCPWCTSAGRQMMRGETVTVFNDMCFFAPGSLLDPSIRWRELDARTVEATYTNGPHTIRAELVFDASGALVDSGPTIARPWPRTGRPCSPSAGPRRCASTGPRGPTGSSRPARPVTPRRAAEYAYIEIEVQEVSTELVPHGDGPR